MNILLFSARNKPLHIFSILLLLFCNLSSHDGMTFEAAKTTLMSLRSQGKAHMKLASRLTFDA